MTSEQRQSLVSMIERPGVLYVGGHFRNVLKSALKAVDDIDRYRKALEFYAEPKLWTHS